MTADVREGLERVLAAPQEDWPRILEELSPAIREQVRELLRYDQTAGNHSLSLAIGDAARNLVTESELAAGSRTGDFRIVRKLGSGGMGTVYLAERAEGSVEQQVALKVIGYGLGPAGVQRFLRERQILARLRHSAIASFLDAGTTDDSRPFVAMELVNGEPIDRYVADRKLTVPEILRLFLLVCEGVEHAHRNFIVHRDLKPGNILVTVDGQPKILDFGIAKTIEEQDAATEVTMTGARLMTPEYASPEQIRGEPVTAATDVHGLGTVLYLLLTGRHPHQFNGLALYEIERLICEQDVERPSRLNRLMKGDLENIILKTLQRDPSRRYASVAALTQDLEAYLQMRPVSATPDSRWYRSRQFLRRNRLTVIPSAVALLALIAAVSVGLYQGRRAQRRFNDVRQLANVFLFDFEKAVHFLPGGLEARRLVSSTARMYLEKLAADSSSDPSLQRELAVSYAKLGRIQSVLGERDQGGGPRYLATLRKGHELRQQLGDAQSSDPAIRAEFILDGAHLALAWAQSKDAKSGLRWSLEATNNAEEWLARAPQDPRALAAAAEAYREHGRVLSMLVDQSGARQAFDKSVARAEEAARAPDPDQSRKMLAARCNFHAADFLMSNEQLYPEALSRAERALALAEELVRADPNQPEWKTVLRDAVSSVGSAHRYLADNDPKHLEPALSFKRRATDLAGELSRADPMNTYLLGEWIVNSFNLAMSLKRMKRYSDSASVLATAERACVSLVGLTPGEKRPLFLLGTARYSRGGVLVSMGDLREAKVHLLSAEQPLLKALTIDPSDRDLIVRRTEQLAYLAMAEEGLGNRAAAQDAIRKRVELVRRNPKIDLFWPEVEQMRKRLGVAAE